MSKYSVLAASIIASLASSASAIEVVDFQNGITELLGGGFYEGILDTEFRSQDPGLTASLANNENISVDGEDGAGGLNETQSAIRFEGLVESGLLPSFVERTDIRFASLSLWKNSPSEDLVNIEFHRVIGPDTFAGRIWEEDDSWAQLAFDLFPTPTGRAAVVSKGMAPNWPKPPLFENPTRRLPTAPISLAPTRQTFSTIWRMRLKIIRCGI